MKPGGISNVGGEEELVDVEVLLPPQKRTCHVTLTGRAGIESTYQTSTPLLLFLVACKYSQTVKPTGTQPVIERSRFSANSFLSDRLALNL